MRLATILAASAIAGLTATASFAAGHATNVIFKIDTAAGEVLSDKDGMALYTFDKDSRKTSNCNGDCAVNWPPLLAAGTDHKNGKLSVIDRADGTRQWAYKGAPLYYWIGDTAPGDINGDGVGGVWHLAKP